ncbi:MAG: FecR family protein [Methyloglobulus sp.]|nr:FecR family protein [Methyloglobulus sp.]
MPRPEMNAQPPDLMEEAVEWLVKLRGGNLSEAQTHDFAKWLSQGSEHAAAFAKAEDFLGEMVAAVKLPRPADVDFKLNAEKPSQQPLTIPPRKAVKTWLAIPLAMAAAWLVAVGLVLPSQSSLWDNLLSDYHTQPGEIRDILLADGSRLLLNTNTAVSVDYNSTKRLVTLHHGEVRFTVAKDARRPFEVKTDSLMVQALGTVFNIYRKEANAIKVTVQEHAVAARIQKEFSTQKPGHSIQVNIQAGQQLFYQGDGTLPQPEAVNLAQSSAWQQYRLFINDRPLGELVEELDRYRMGRIYLSDAKLKNLRVTGVFPLDNPEEVIASVRKVLGLQETRIGPWLVLHQ